MQVSKWGKGLAIRLPASVVAALQLEGGDEVEVIVADPTSFVVARSDRREAILERLKALQGRLPVGFRLDRNVAHKR